jgi:hypothetical protein
MAKKTKVEEPIVSPISSETLFAPVTPEEKRAERLVAIAQQQLLTSMKYKEKRMQEIQKNEDLYYGKTKKALKGRWNVPLPLMSGYVDTLLSKIDDPPRVKYGYQDVADMELAQKVQAKWDQESISVKNQWALKDRQEKKLATLSGVGISKTYAYRDENGKYVSVYDVIDYLDFECEPMGGQLLQNHTFKGQRNIFKTKSQLTRGATGANATYNRRQVLKLLISFGSRDQKEFQQLYMEKTDRLRALGFNVDQGSYVGIPIYNFVEWYMEDPDNGEKYYLLFEPHTGIWIRGCPLTDVFENDCDPFDAWHTHPDAFNFWSKSPADDMRPVADSMNVIFNQALDARDRKIYHQRMYDPSVFTDPAQLEWRPDGLVEATAGISATQALSSGIYELKIEGVDEAATINLMTYMDQISGTKTGITPGSQGATEDKRVGIYFGNLQQVADRLGLYNKSYSEAWGSKGLKFFYGLKENITNDGVMVRMIGDKGYNWTTLTKYDVDKQVQEFDITIVGGQAEAAADEIKKKTKEAALAILMANPNTAARMNPDVLIEESLRNAGWEDGEVKRFLDNQPPGSELLISQAHQAIQEILLGKTPKQHRGATTLYMQTIVDFAQDSDDLDLETYSALMDYAGAHMPIAVENAMRKIRLQAAVESAKMGAQGGPEAPGGGMGAPEGQTLVPGAPVADDIGFTGTPTTPATAIAAGMPGMGA